MPARYVHHAAQTGPAVYVLVPLALVAVVGTLLVWNWLKLTQGRQSLFMGSKGPATLTDYGDGMGAFAGTIMICLYGALMGVAAIAAGVMGLARNPVMSLLLFPVGGGILWLSHWYFQTRREVMQKAKPGALVVPHWPLAQGKTIQVAYQRALKDPSCRLKAMFAELQLFETYSTYNYTRKRYDHHVELIERHDLGDGGGKQSAEGLSAVFKFQVPHPDGARPRGSWDSFKAAFGLGRKRQWRLRVHLNVENLPDNDSSFDLIVRGNGKPQGPVIAKPGTKPLAG